MCVASFALLLEKNWQFVKIWWRNQKWAEENQRQEKRRIKRGKNDKTPQELPAKKMEDMTNEELNALLIPGILMLDDDYGMECLLIN